MKVLVPGTIDLAIEDTGEDSYVRYEVDRPIPEGDRDAEVLVVWQNPARQLRESARTLGRLRLVQALASGADVALAAGFAPEVPICSGRSLHDGPVAEHALALTLAAVRRLDRLQRSQQARRWDDEYVAAQSAPDTKRLYTLNGARVTIWGFGSIAARLAPMLAALGADVRGIARTAGRRSGFPVFATADAGEVLRTTDVLISVVPATGDTVKLFDSGVFGALPQGAVFVNVGRGATVDEDALVAALADGRLRAAAIDVTAVEPLAPESALWDAENLIITPHVAGNRPEGAAALIAANLSALRSGGVLVNRVRP